MIRREVAELTSLGRFPPSHDVDPTVILRQQELLRQIVAPVSDDEARELVSLFGPDEYFGGVWTLIHLVESAPNWPLMDIFTNEANEWIACLKSRLK